MTRGYSLLMCNMSQVSKKCRKARYEHGNSMETGGYKPCGTSRPVENWADYRAFNPYTICDKASGVHFQLTYAATEKTENCLNCKIFTP